MRKDSIFPRRYLHTCSNRWCGKPRLARRPGLDLDIPLHFLALSPQLHDRRIHLAIFAPISIWSEIPARRPLARRQLTADIYFLRRPSPRVVTFRVSVSVMRAFLREPSSGRSKSP
ncbi:hypothetical protein BS17DRAFT_76565 [Gyrodon lividus]|nr:hypothetical protein BS17DRAFT_76565 [Gyrodon lividus]